jgi:predicted enzyme related to lactoylglutathione lyase
MGKPVVHFEVIGTDATQLHRFYRELFDWPIQAMPEMGYGLVDKAATGTIGGGIGHSEDPQARGVVIYVEVDDLQAYLDRAERLGGKTIIPVTEIPNTVTFAQFVDPQGNRIGLVKS